MNGQTTNQTEKRLCVGLLAHVDAGKTTLSEAMLYAAGAIRTFGRVDHQDTFLDTDQQERSRGITIFSKQAVLQLPGCTITLLDTPGHVDFSAEMERTLQVLDCAILVISGTDGVQGHTKTLWQLLRRYQIPTLLFINKMDIETADRAQRMDALARELSETCIDFSLPPAELAERLALCDEALLERYLAESTLSDAQIAVLVGRRKVFPCFFGSALRRQGVDALLQALPRIVPAPPDSGSFGAHVFKIARDPKGVRLTFLKVTGGTLQVKQLLEGADWAEKADQLRLYSGSRYTLLQQAPAGTICAVTGLTKTMPGDVLGQEADAQAPSLQPVLEYRLQVENGDSAQAYGQLRVLEEEDPQLHLIWDARLREIRVQLMGPVQMEILQTLIADRFGLQVSFDAGNIVYLETIAAPVEGIGHYEPLRPYAEVHLLLEPAEPGTGLQFDTMCPTDTLALHWQRLILAHLAEKAHRGVLTGAPLTDVRITLVSGRAHLKHTEGGDFRQATYRAVRQGLMKAKSVLLEPWYAFRIELPAACAGHAITDIQRMQGVCSAPETQDTQTILTGSAPVRLLRGYAAELTAYTRGRGRIYCRAAGYRPCPDQQALVQARGYDPARDLDNPAGSIFCSHGAGYEVKWQDVDQAAHLPLLRLGGAEPDAPAPRKIVRSVAPGGAPELEKELLAIFERTYGAIRRRDALPQMALRSEDKREFLQQLEPAEDFLLVDGYNVIFAWDELKELARTSLDTARHVLMNYLCNYQGYRGCTLILVFDAYKVPQGLGSVEKYHNIYIVYTRHAETADQYIERLSFELRGRRRVRVATSDNLEQLIILGHGAERISSQYFHDEVFAAQAEIDRILTQNNKKNNT